MNQIASRPHRSRRVKWLLATVVVAIACYFLLPLLMTALAKRLIRVDALTSADVIIALGGDARCLRERRAFDLYQRGLARRIIVSGVPFAWGMNSGDAAKQYLVSLGLPENDVIVLRESWNTRREAIDVAPIMKANGWHSALIVTSPFHSRRALYTFERYAPGFTFHSSPLPAESPEWRPERWWSRRGDMGSTVREFLSWTNTLIGGLR